jgi:dolichyl-phosphate beta-glucosyltransferase
MNINSGQICYVLPVHNEAEILRESVNKITEYLSEHTANSFLVLVENGSSDDSLAIAKDIANETKNESIAAISVPRAGLGHALHAGVEKALEIQKENKLSDMWIVLTAADLPFGFSDFESFLKWQANHKETRIAVGSKAHNSSSMNTSLKRKIMSLIYRLARFLILGMKTKDSQGSIFVHASVAKDINVKIKSRDFFYSTEFIYYAEKNKCKVGELPVVEQGFRRPSTVKPLRDGLGMLLQLFKLRFRH